MKEKFYVDPKDIAKKFDIDVRPIKSEKIQTEWLGEIGHIDNDLCGYIEKLENGKVIIYYNPLHHENRQRFTIAHELAHFLLGHLDENHKLYRDTTKNFRSDMYDLKEINANKMAASILMPEKTIRYLIFTKGITSIKELAKIMKVSELAMKYRLQNLGLISG